MFRHLARSAVGIILSTEFAKMTWLIRVATPEDASALPPIEFSAGRRFLAIPDLALLPDGDDMPIEAHQRYIVLGTEWVAVSESQELVGFLAAEIVSRDLHIWEFAVRGDVQNRGIGRQLIDAAEFFARERHLESLTLTTFSHVPWNAPWYSRMGFEINIGDERLAALVRAETEHGWPRRCAMRKVIDGM
jgi:GNAT superfamily N-acetyltransferase